VCGAESPAAGDSITAEDVTRLLASLAREFRYVVVDTAPGLSEPTLAALDRATDVVMLTSMDVPGVRGLRKELDVLRELAMIPAGRHVVMNFADPKGGLTVRDVETTIGTGVDVVLPRSSAVPSSTNQGVPILESGARRDPMVKELKRLVSRFAATPLMKPGRYRAKHRAAAS
jgi:pilus assembly protein CpaE